MYRASIRVPSMFWGMFGRVSSFTEPGVVADRKLEMQQTVIEERLNVISSHHVGAVLIVLPVGRPIVHRPEVHDRTHVFLEDQVAVRHVLPEKRSRVSLNPYNWLRAYPDSMVPESHKPCEPGGSPHLTCTWGKRRGGGGRTTTEPKPGPYCPSDIGQ